MHEHTPEPDEGRPPKHEPADSRSQSFESLALPCRTYSPQDPSDAYFTHFLSQFIIADPTKSLTKEMITEITMNPSKGFRTIHNESSTEQRTTLHELHTRTRRELRPLLPKDVQVRFLHPLVLNQTVLSNSEIGSYTELQVYTAMLELRQPEKEKSYALVSSSKELELFSHPVAYLLAYFESDNPQSEFHQNTRSWLYQPTLSPHAFNESLQRFSSLYASEPSTVREHAQRDLTKYLYPRELDDPDIQERLHIKQGRNGTLLLSFDGEHLPEFDIHLHPLHLTVQTTIPASLIIRLKRDMF
ncbi:MAG: hypothetical protein ACO3XO_08405 [Bdellovibrionota bacterium]|jgi:hypothetical protein